MKPAARTIVTAGLLVAGVTLWVVSPAGPPVPPLGWRIFVLVAAAVIGLLPGTSGPCFRAIRRLRQVDPRTRSRATLVIFLAAAAYLTFTAFRQGRALYPKYHDNQSYAVQAQIVAAGRLWLPPHPHADFFDTFHVLARPVYASMYFPGAALLFAAGVLLHLPWWVVPVVVSGGCVGMLYRVVAELVDGLAGLVAAVWLVSLIWFRHLSTTLMSHQVLLLVGLSMVWAYLRWRPERRLRWALLVGAFSGFGAITRPADALCYAIPIGVAILLELRGRGGRWPADLARAGAVIVVAAMPFLALQLVFNYGVSGSLTTSPYRVYLDRDAPQLSFGFHDYDATLSPQSPIVQKHIYHREFNASLIKQHRPGTLVETWFEAKDGRLWTVLTATSPSLLVMPFALAGLLGLVTARRPWVLAAVLPLYCLLYLFYAALLRHYTPVVAPATMLLAVVGARQAEVLWPRARAGVAVFATATLVGLCLSNLPELNRHQRDDPFDYFEMHDTRVLLPRDPRLQRPALVFSKFTARPGANVHAEPVYNYDAARIDDNPIVFAHDLGPRNVELLSYYAKEQPGRRVYYYDRATRGLTPAGSVGEELSRLAQQQHQPPATAPATTAPVAP